MQSITNKIFTIVLSILLLSPCFGNNHRVEDQLIKADSLYQKKNFTEAIKILETSLNEEFFFTERGLIQMAAIYSASNDTAKYVQSLEILYKYFPNELYKNKINEVSAKLNEANLINTDPWGNLKIYLQIYERPLSVTLAAMSICLIILYWLLLFKENRKLQGLLNGALGFIFLLILNINLNEPYVDAITTGTNTYIRLEPSNASLVTQKIEGVKKLSVLGYSDIWIKVRFANKTGYINKNKLIFII